MGASIAPSDVFIQGDEHGRVVVRFTAETLREFVGLLNTNKIRNGRGELLIFSVKEFEPGDATLELTLVRDF